MIKKAGLKIAFIALVFGMTGFSYADPVWVDVRTALEHSLDSIDGDRRISHGQIVEKVSELYPDKETEINVYCRSGNRAGKAKAALNAAGYTHITNAGSIGDARLARGLKR